MLPMASSPARRWLAALLLMTVLAPEAFPLSALGHRCACGMVVGCCCLRRAAMKAGDHCSLHQPAPSCSLRPGRDATAEILPRRENVDWVGALLRGGPRLALAPAAALAVLDESPPDLARPAPPVPPPRPVPAV